MTWTKWGIALGLTLLAPGLDAQQQEKAGQLTFAVEGVRTDKGQHFEFPNVVGWKYKELDCEPITTDTRDARTVWSFRVKTEAHDGLIVDFVLLTGARPTLRLQTIYDNTDTRLAQQRKAGSIVMGSSPVVHRYFPIDGGESVLNAYLHANGRVLVLRFRTLTKHFDALRPALLELVPKIRIKNLPTWPERPSGFDYEPESGMEIGFARSVSKKRRAQMHKLVRNAIKDFTKMHGAPNFEPSAPVILFVSDDMDGNAQLVDDDEPDTYGFELSLRRMATIVVDPKQADSVSGCRQVLARYFAWTVYPEQDDCLWLHWAIRYHAALEAWCGKRLPSVPEDRREQMARIKDRLDRFAIGKGDNSLLQAVAWMAYFQLGPAKHKKAFQAWLEELRTGWNPEKANADFLALFDHVKLRDDARKLLGRKLKGVKSK